MLLASEGFTLVFEGVKGRTDSRTGVGWLDHCVHVASFGCNLWIE